MKGYLMLSSENWCRNIKDLRTDTAVFWRKRTTFKAIDIGEYVYFMTGKLSSKGRCIVGRGKLRETTSMNASDAWLRYGSQMGYYEKQEFTASVSMRHIDSHCFLWYSISKWDSIRKNTKRRRMQKNKSIV